jgi:hypothetical protein
MTNAVDLKEKTERTDEVILSIEKKLDTLNALPQTIHKKHFKEIYD